MNIGERIKYFREQRNITVNKLANLSGVSQSYLREIELGLKQPTVEYLEYICFGLNISLQEFFSEENSDINPSVLFAIKKLSQDEQIKLAEFINAVVNSNN